jgi:hypothetical protein
MEAAMFLLPVIGRPSTVWCLISIVSPDMVRLFGLIGISFALHSIQAAPASAPVGKRDVAVFRAVMREGLLPEPTVGDARVKVSGVAIESPMDIPAPAVVSQTLRPCLDGGDDVACVPESAMYSIRVNAVASGAEIEALVRANTIPRTIPADSILVVPHDHVFGGRHSWSQWRSWRDERNIPACVQFTVPAYLRQTAVVYAQRIGNRLVYGWFVRLTADGDQWRVETKRIVWASHPSL